ncbi:Nephrocystin-3 [Paramuricea clavata]|uniref:Nephrocystin-3, partial n=1 Tax=Paramuricea clavata TaxID=317549 RepID=A0A7D9IRA0_PARCT|nr:Nephrocystin-3 [Paramuricea clavata]
MEPIVKMHINEDSLPRSHVPAPVRYFVGRENEVQQITSLLTCRSTRLVNIWGSPGFGKTSTAIAVARHLHSLGHPVYFFKFQGISSIDKFYSKILSIFNLTNDNIAPVDKLVSVFRGVPCHIFLVFDNLDDLLACKSDDTADVVVQVIREFLDSHEDINILLTTREFLESLSSQISEFGSLRIRPLDQASSNRFVRNFIPVMTEELITKVTKISGNIPLAMKLLATLIQNCSEKDAKKILDDIPVSKVLGMIENPYEEKLRKLFVSSFDHLLQSEQEAFVSLTVFRGDDIDVEAALAVVGGDEFKARRSLSTLVNKSLIDQDSGAKLVSVHPLLYSFAKERSNQDDLKNATVSSYIRYLRYYLRLFEKLNELVLAGKPLDRFRAYKAYDNIEYILFEKLIFSLTYEDVLEILTKSELFLYSLYAGPSQNYRVNYLYDLGIRFAEKRNKSLHCKLITSKCFGSTTMLCLSPEISKVSESIRKEVALMTDGTAAKFACYEGLYEISSGRTKSGVLRVEKGLFGLKSCTDQQTLKCLCLQLLSLYYKFAKDLEKCEQFSKMAFEVAKQIGNSRLFLIDYCEPADKNGVDKSLGDNKSFPQPSILLFLAFSLWVNNFVTDENKYNLSSFICKLQQETEEELFDSSYLMRILRSGDIGLAYLSTKHKAMLDEVIQTIKNKLRIKDITKGGMIDVDVKSNKTARAMLHRLGECCFLRGTGRSNEPDLNRQTLHGALEISRKLYGDQCENAAQCFYYIGVLENIHENYDSALVAHEQALKIRLSLSSQPNRETSYSRSQIGKTQRNLGNLKDAIVSYQLALDIWLEIEGNVNYEVAKTHFKIGNTQRGLGDFIASLESHQRALDVMLRTQGEVNKLVFKIYLGMAVTQKIIQDYVSSLKLHKQAFDIRKKMDEEDGEWVAEMYGYIGHTQSLLEDYSSSLDSYQRALDIRLKIHGNESQWVAQSYHSIGETQMKLGNIPSSFESYQRALDIMLKLDGGKNPFTFSVYFGIGIAHMKIDNYAASIESFQHAMKFTEDTESDERAGRCLFHTGIAQNYTGDYNLSTKSFQRALKICDELGDHPSISACIYSWIGRNYYSMQKYTKAIQSCQRSVDISLVSPQNREVTAESYFWMAKAQFENGMHNDVAIKSLNNAIQLFKLLGKQHRLMIHSYYLMGIIQIRTRDHASAIHSFEIMLKISEASGKKDMTTADCHFRLACAQYYREAYKESLTSMYAALKISLDINGKMNATTAEYFCFIGKICKMLGNRLVALSNFKTSLRICMDIFGENHPDTMESLSEVQDASTS